MNKYFNLQLFAEMNTQTTLLGGLSVENKTYYDMTLIDEAGPELVHDQFGQKRDIPKNGGKKIEFRKFASLPKALTPLTEGVTPDGGNLNVTAIEAEVSQYGYYIVQSDILELTTIDNTIVEATKVLGRQAGQTLDTIVRNVLHTGTNVYFCPSAAAPDTEITQRESLAIDSKLSVDVIEQVVATLKANNAPKINGDYVAIIHPHAAYDLRRDPDWIASHQYAKPEELYNGEIGKIAGVRFVETSEAKIYEGGIYGTLIFGDGAYGTTEVTGGGLQTIIKQKGSAGTADPLDQRSSIGWKALKTAEILVEPYLIRVESKSPRFSDKAKAN